MIIILLHILAILLVAMGVDTGIITLYLLALTTYFVATYLAWKRLMTRHYTAIQDEMEGQK